MTPSWNDEQLELKKDLREFQQEYTILEAQDAISLAMEQAGVNRSELAGRLERTKGFITQLLSGNSNMTLRTLSDIFTALGFTLKMTFVPLTVAVESIPEVQQEFCWQDQSDRFKNWVSARPVISGPAPAVCDPQASEAVRSVLGAAGNALAAA